MNKFYDRINQVVESYEMFKAYHPLSIEWAADYLVWCAKFKKIPKNQVDELADRITKIFDDMREGGFYG